MMRRHTGGFTLIELAIVTAIIGLLAAGAVASFGALRTNTKIKETTRAVHAAELALQTFLARNGRLPCPADPTLGPADAGYATESLLIIGVNQLCAVARRIAGTSVYWGTLPAISLGIPPREITDGWDHQLLYVVVGNAARPTALTNLRWALDDNASNEIELADRPNGVAGRVVLVNQGVAALISTGANGSGGYTLNGAQLDAPVATAVAELDNLDPDIFLVSTDYSEDAATPFDDIVRVYTEDDLVMPLARLGEVQTKRALTIERMERLVDRLYGFAAGDPSDQIPDHAGAGGVQGAGVPLPPALGNFPWNDLNMPREDASDAWGLLFSYFRNDPDTAVANDEVQLDSANREICMPDEVTRFSAEPLFTIRSATDPTISVAHTLGEAIGRINRGVVLSPCP